MSSRTGIRHYTQTTRPDRDMQIGDEWFDPTTNRLYKFMVRGGVVPSWIELFNGASGSAYAGPAQELYYILQNGYTGFNSTGVQGIFGTNNDGRGVGVRVTAETLYLFEMNVVWFKTAGTTSHTLATAFSGTANLNFINYQAIQNDGGVAMNTRSTSAGFGSTGVNTAASTVVTSAMASATQYISLLVKGIVSARTAGTFIPQYNLSAAPGGAYTTQPGSYISLTSIPPTSGTWL